MGHTVPSRQSCELGLSLSLSSVHDEREPAKAKRASLQIYYKSCRALHAAKPWAAVVKALALTFEPVEPLVVLIKISVSLRNDVNAGMDVLRFALVAQRGHA